MINCIYESDGTHNGETIYCPVNAWDCPYCGENNICYIFDPMTGCDDFFSVFESWEEWEKL